MYNGEWNSSINQWYQLVVVNETLLTSININSKVLVRQCAVDSQTAFYTSGSVTKIESYNVDRDIRDTTIDINLDAAIDGKLTIQTKLGEIYPYDRINIARTPNQYSVGKTIVALQDERVPGVYITRRVDRIEYSSSITGSSRNSTVLCCSDGQTSSRITLKQPIQLIQYPTGIAYYPSIIIETFDKLIKDPILKLEDISVDEFTDIYSKLLQHFTTSSIYITGLDPLTPGQHQEFIHVLRLLEDLLLILRYTVLLVVHCLECSAATNEDSVHNFGSPTRNKSSQSNGKSSPLHSALLQCIMQTSTVLSTSGITLISRLHVPFVVSTQQWVSSLHAACRCRTALESLITALTSLVGLNDSYQSALTSLQEVLTKCESTIECAGDDGIIAICTFIDAMLLDSVSRQEWKSHSGFMRDKRISHGMVAATSTMRGLMHDLFRYCPPGDVWYAGLSEVLCFQSLLSFSYFIVRIYLQIETSRVRLFQWKADLNHLVYVLLDSLIWVVKNRLTSDENRRNEMIGELSSVIHYLMVILYLVGAPCEDASLLTSLETLKQINVRNNNTPGENGLDELKNLLRRTLLSSLVDLLFDDYESEFHKPSIVNDGLLFDMTGEITAYKGMLQGSNNYSLLNNEEVLLYDKEQKTKPDNLLMGYRGVVFHRITNFRSLNSEPLISRIINEFPKFRRIHTYAITTNYFNNDVESLSDAVWMKSCINDLMNKRFEMIDCEYPVLNPNQVEHAAKIKEFMETWN